MHHQTPNTDGGHLTRKQPIEDFMLGCQALEDFLKKAGIWDDVASLDSFQLSKLMDDPPWPGEIADAVARFGRRESIERIYLRKKKEFEERA